MRNISDLKEDINIIEKTLGVSEFVLFDLIIPKRRKKSSYIVVKYESKLYKVKIGERFFGYLLKSIHRTYDNKKERLKKREDKVILTNEGSPDLHVYLGESFQVSLIY